MANNRKRLQGRVVSDKMDKTVVVEIEQRKMHRVYKKFVTSSSRVMAHDETNAVEVGTVVRIVESRPLSKRKRWVVESVVTKQGEIEDIEEIETTGEDDEEATE